MNYNTICLGVAAPKDGCVFDVGSLYAAFERLVDRRHARGKRYRLAFVLVMVMLAKLSGEDQLSGIAEWVQLRGALLREALGLPHPKLLCHNTYRRVLREAVDVTQLQAVVSAFLTQGRQTGESLLIAIDGKTLRGSIPQGQTRGVHLLAAYLPCEGIVLMQVAVEHKENEIVAAPKVLKALDLRGKIVMGDALLTQRDLSVQILQAGGQYVWLVKDNQPQLHQDIEQVFEPEVCVPGFSPIPKDFQTAHTIDKAHGRFEQRTLTTSSVLREYADWPGLEQVFKLERRIVNLKDGALRREVVYGLTSLSANQTSPSHLLALVRNYWGIENGLHYRRDQTLREDATRMTHPTLAEAMAVLNNLVIGLVIRQGWRYLPTARRHFNARLSDALSLVLCATG
jgi:predicted transposase YbfD/YdcC